MILCFSGTGNSRFVAEKIADKTDDRVINLNDKIKNNDYSSLSADGKLVIVTPTYAWRIPRVVTEWIEKTKISGTNGVWFVMTCGGEVGNAEKHNKILCEKKGFAYMGTAQIVMPENYIAMFGAPQIDEARQIVNNALPDIEKAVDCILNGRPFAKLNVGFKDKMLSGIVNDVFYPMCVKSKAFYATDACVSCGKCAKLCPLNNVELINGKPVWENNCTHCMACICYCPVEAIEYGNKSKDKPRYHIENL
ncbi:MAG: EFR1 family ferrodoxin [Clostridia bacterium]|nr:EFR1 family ferrodoxin [Clostridia bacterium]